MRAPEHVRTVTPMTTDTIDDTRTNDVESSDSVLDKIRAMAPAIAARGDEIEQGRRLPTDLVEKLSTAGCFRAMVPASHGGQGLTFAEQLIVIRELARADGSVGWTVMIGSSAPVVLGLLPRSSFDQIYAKGPDVILGGRSIRRAWPHRSTAGTGCQAVGRSPAGASTVIGSSPTAWSTTAACPRYG